MIDSSYFVMLVTPDGASVVSHAGVALSCLCYLTLPYVTRPRGPTFPKHVVGCAYRRARLGREATALKSFSVSSEPLLPSCNASHI